MNSLTEAGLSIMLAIIGVAILSVIVSRKSNTAGVLSAFGQSFSNMLSAATAPVTGNAATPNVGGGLSANSLGGIGGLSMGGFGLPQ